MINKRVNNLWWDLWKKQEEQRIYYTCINWNKDLFVLFPLNMKDIDPPTEHVDPHGAPYLFTFPPACLPGLGSTFDGRTGSVYGQSAVSVWSTASLPSGWGVTHQGFVSDVLKEAQVGLTMNCLIKANLIKDSLYIETP